MLHFKSVKFNFIMNLLLTVSNFLFPLITFPYVSRVLLPEGTGKVAFATSIITYFTIVAGFGVSNYGVRSIAQVRGDKEKLTKLTQEILIINIFIMFFVYLILFVCLSFIDSLAREFILFSVLSLSIFFSILGVEWFYKGMEQYAYITVRTLLFKVVSIFLIFLFVKDKDDYIIFAGISVFSISISSLLNFINLRKYLFFKIYEAYNFKQHIKPMLALFLSGFIIIIYTNIDSTMLGLFVSNEDVGIYSAAMRIRGLLVALVTSLGIVLLPRLSSYVYSGMDDEFKETLNKSMEFIFVISLPISIFFIFFAELIILLFAGGAYHSSIIPLKIAMLVVPLMGITNLLGGQILLPLGKDKQYLLSVFFGGGVNIVLNLYLIPMYASIGASIAAVITEFLVFIIQCFFVRTYLIYIFKSIEYIKIIISILFAVCVTVLIDTLFPPTFPLLDLSVLGIVFFMIYFIFLIVLKEKLVIGFFYVFKNKLKI